MPPSRAISDKWQAPPAPGICVAEADEEDVEDFDDDDFDDDFDGLVLYVEEVKPKTLQWMNVFISDSRNPAEVHTIIAREGEVLSDPGKLADFIASSLSTIGTATKQEILEILDLRERMSSLNRILIKELEVLELGSKIQSQVQSEVGKNQRDYFLREQLKAIQKELGEGDDQTKEIEELADKIEAVGMPDAVAQRAAARLAAVLDEAHHLERQHRQHARHHVQDQPAQERQAKH